MDEVAVRMRMLQQSFDAFDEAAATLLGLNRTDLRCLDLILAKDPMSAGELTTAAKLSPAATTTAIDRLERAGFVTRNRDATNRRRVLVSATEAARAAEREVYGPVGEAGTMALRRYGKDQLAVIIDFLETSHRVQEEQTARLKGLPVRE
ncbi:MarR family winged helix-turn-helix transcriptional regulator [Streptomyces inhibens]|uniref:MarR family winged helix-turn-helix transcriptional regulator n=1 Tax=Streptomyces inhibens TaxID=2293571 RepID=UPI001EE6C86C|nr:MarR family transcriptional regulator [Streptomyces inhibens]UKY47436.1 MarR family transcriptional regulator [Streptomyces inhibens]